VGNALPIVLSGMFLDDRALYATQVVDRGQFSTGAPSYHPPCAEVAYSVSSRCEAAVSKRKTWPHNPLVVGANFFWQLDALRMIDWLQKGSVGPLVGHRADAPDP
jgi:hypothetical protein